jgi:hypothetical protein
LDDVANQSEFHFAFTFSEDEILAFRKSRAALYARGDNNFTVYGLLIAAPMAIGFAMLGAFNAGLIAPAALRPVLVTAFAAFTAGVTAHYFLVKRHLRKLNASAERGWRGTWNISFDDSGIRYKNETLNVQLTWRAVDGVRDLRSFVVVSSCGRATLPLPSRVFGDNAARAAFVAAAAARIKAAAESRP